WGSASRGREGAVVLAKQPEPRHVGPERAPRPGAPGVRARGLHEVAQQVEVILRAQPGLDRGPALLRGGGGLRRRERGERRRRCGRGQPPRRCRPDSRLAAGPRVAARPGPEAPGARARVSGAGRRANHWTSATAAMSVALPTAENASGLAIQTRWRISGLGLR